MKCHTSYNERGNKAVCIHREGFKTELNNNPYTNTNCYNHFIFRQDITFWKKCYQPTCNYKTFELRHKYSKNNNKIVFKYEKWQWWDYRCDIKPWWHHQMETYSALLAICAGNSPVPGEFPTQRPVTQSFDVFVDLRLNKQFSKQSRGWWLETPSRPLWRHCNVETLVILQGVGFLY